MTIYNEKQYMSVSLIKERDPVIQLNIAETKNELENHLIISLDRKGGGSFTSIHEIYGSLSAKMHEILSVVADKDLEAVSEELLDLACVAFWGAASINQKIGKYGK